MRCKKQSKNLSIAIKNSLTCEDCAWCDLLQSGSFTQHSCRHKKNKQPDGNSMIVKHDFLCIYFKTVE